MGLFDFLKRERIQEPEMSGEEPSEGREQEAPEREGETPPVAQIPWPAPPPINPLRVTNQTETETALPSSGRIEEDRRDEVGAMLLKGDLNPDTLRFLSLQELLFAQTALEAFREQDLLPKVEENRRRLFNEVIARIRAAEKLYVLYDLSTGYPFIDGSAALFYLEQDKAEYGVRLYSKQNRTLAIRQVAGEGSDEAAQNGSTFFDYLYYLGVENCVLDNGLYRLRFERTQIVAPRGDWGEQKETLPDNGEAVYAILDFLQELRWRVGYAQRAEVLKAKEDRMMRLVRKARFIVPTRPEGPAEVLENGLIRVDERTRVQFPMMQGQNGEQYQPVFTDGIEFAKRFSGGGWLGGVYTVEALAQVATDKTGIVVNPDGERLLLRMDHLTALDT